MTYTAFLNGLLLGRFKFYLAERRVMSLEEALRRLKISYKLRRYAVRKTLFGKTLRKEERMTKVSNWTSVLGRMMKELVASTSVLRIFWWKSRVT